jgi:hypothetical protein
MSVTTTPLTLDEYKRATRKTFEQYVEKIARIEQAVDLEPGTLIDGCVEWMCGNSSGDDAIDYIEGAYQLLAVPADWKDRVREICDGGAQ